MSNEVAINASDHLFDDEDTVIRFTVDDGAATPAAVNVAGWTVEFVVRPDADTAASITKTTGDNGVTLTTPASGIIDVAILVADVAALGGKSYSYVLRRTDSGVAKRLAYGAFVIGG